MLVFDSVVGRKKDDPIIYFTLIDFLVQLIFFGLLLAVVFFLSTDSKPDGTVRVAKIYVPIIDGSAPWVRADKIPELVALLKRLPVDQTDNIRSILGTPEVVNFCSKNQKLCSEWVQQCRRDENLSICEMFAGASHAQVTAVGVVLGGIPICGDGSDQEKWLFEVTAEGNPKDATYTITHLNTLQSKFLSSLGSNISVGTVVSIKDLDRFFSVFDVDKTRCQARIKLRLKGDSHSVYKYLRKYFRITEVA